MEGRVIEYRHPGGGLDYHNSPLIGEIPSGEYTIVHRSIDQLRLLNERNALSEISNTDLRTSIISNHLEYKYTNNNIDEDGEDGRELHYMNNDKHLVVVQQIDKNQKFEQKIENETYHHGSSSPRSQISSHSDEDRDVKDVKKKVFLKF